MRGLPTRVVALSATGGDRVWVGTAGESLHALRYRAADNSLALLADDTCPRHTTCIAQLDADTCAVGDKFGNVAILRLPEAAAGEEAGLAAPAGRALWDTPALNGAPHKLETVAQFHLGEAVTALHKARMGSGQVRGGGWSGERWRSGTEGAPSSSGLTVPLQQGRHCDARQRRNRDAHAPMSPAEAPHARA